MRLPANPDNWTGRHAERALDLAWRLFSRYERCGDFSEKSRDLYRDYQIARETAVDVCSRTRWRVTEAKLLP